MSDLRGAGYLKEKLAQKADRVKLRYRYYEMKEISSSRGILTPPWLKGIYKGTVGWCTKAVDCLADRLVFLGFDDDSDVFGANQIFEMNNPDIFFDAAIRESLIGSCSFIHITHGEGEERIPRLSVLTAADATGVIDEFTGLLKEGYAVLGRDDLGNPTKEAYFTPEWTEYLIDGQEIIEENPARYPLLVPVPFKPDSKRPFGHSRISRDCMYYQQFAQNTLERAEISAEFYSFPQKYITGVNPDADPIDSWKASISSFLWFDKDQDGDHPVLGQFQQQSMTPYVEQMRMIASHFAGAADLTLDDLGYVSQNPSSAEAIKASHENLRLTARKAQRTYGSAFANVGYLAASLRDEMPYGRELTAQMEAKWEPVFEPDAAAIGLIGDGALKVNQAVPGYFDSKSIRDLTGIDAADEPIGITEEAEEVAEV